MGNILPEVIDKSLIKLTTGEITNIFALGQDIDYLANIVELYFSTPFCAKVFNKDQISVQKCAQILASKVVSLEKVDDILSNSYLDLDRALDIGRKIIYYGRHEIETIVASLTRGDFGTRVWKNILGYLYDRTLYSSADRISTIGSPSITDTTLDGDKAVYLYRSDYCVREGIGISSYSYTDVEEFADVYGVKGSLYLRSQSTDNFDNTYLLDFDTPSPTEDFRISKVVDGTGTSLATEDVDLSSTTRYYLKFEIVGSELRGYRNDYSTAKLTATDTTFTQGCSLIGRHGVDLTYACIYIKPYGSVINLPKPIYFVEVGIREEYEGKYKFLNPDVPHDTNKNILITYGSIAVKPELSTAIIKIFYLTNEAKSILETSTKYKILSKDEVIKRAKEIDPLLSEEEIIHAVEPRPPISELRMLAKFYEREVFDTNRIKLGVDIENQINTYINKLERLGETTYSSILKRVLRK